MNSNIRGNTSAEGKYLLNINLAALTFNVKSKIQKQLTDVNQKASAAGWITEMYAHMYGLEVQFNVCLTESNVQNHHHAQLLITQSRSGFFFTGGGG